MTRFGLRVWERRRCGERDMSVPLAFFSFFIFVDQYAKSSTVEQACCCFLWLIILLVESKLNWNWNWKYKVIYCRTGLAYILYHRPGLGQRRHVCPVFISSLYINQITFAPRATFCQHLSSASTPPPPTERFARQLAKTHLLRPGLHYYTIAQTSVKRV